jgi:hypothetical protein
MVQTLRAVKKIISEIFHSRLGSAAYRPHSNDQQRLAAKLKKIFSDCLQLGRAGLKMED